MSWTSTSPNMSPLPNAGKVTSEGTSEVNDARTEALRRALQSTLDYGSAPFLARRSGVCLSSVQKQVEGQQRLSAPLLRAVLLLHSPDEAAELLSMWLGLPLEHRP